MSSSGSSSEGSDGSSSESTSTAPPADKLKTSNTKATPPPSPTKVAQSPFTTGGAHASLKTPLIDQIRERFERPMNLLPIHTDFLRFFPGTSLSEDGEVLWSKYRDTPKYKEKSKEFGMREFFCLLAERDTDDPLLTAWVRKKFFEYIPDGKSAEGAQTPIHFARLLRDVIPETSNIAGVLKCINQAISAPAALILRLKSMPRKLMFKDGRFWDCEVQFFEDKVIVAHVKCEESIPKALEFVWCLEMELTRDGKQLVRAEMRIDTIKYLPTMSQADKNNWKPFFDELRTPNTQELTVT